MSDYDAIIVGGGHNGLVAALYLAKAGWKTLVIEKNPLVGGAVMSGEITRPGFIHDLYSTNQNLFVASPVYQEFESDLKRNGLRYQISSRPYSNVFPEGKSLRVYKDPNRTYELIRQHSTGDAEGWAYLYNQFKVFRRTLMPIYNMPISSMNAVTELVQAARKVGMKNILDIVQILLSSTRELGEIYFDTPEARALLSTWGMHFDYAPDVSGGAMFPFIEAFTDMEVGIAIAEGGASQMVDALALLIQEHGGEVVTRTEVKRILVEGKRAAGVELADGMRITAGKAVIANLTPTILFDRLLAGEPLPPGFRRDVRAYRYGPGTMMIHLALSGKPDWAAGEDLDQFAYVHIAPYAWNLAQTYNESISGMLPSSPLVIVGQTSAVDPTRAPGDQQVLWIQVRTLPSIITGDAAGDISARNWDEAKEPFADRVIQKLEEYAPGVSSKILDRVVYSPLDLERHNPNLQGGDSLSGSHHLRQYFFLRPVPGWSQYEMPVKNLYMVGAATWPGAGTNGISGILVSKKLVTPEKRRIRVAQGAAAVGSLAAVGLLASRWLSGNGKK